MPPIAFSTDGPMSESLLPVAVISLDREENGNRGLLETLLRRVVGRGAQLVVIPYGFPAMEGESARGYFRALAREHGVVLVAGFEEEGKRLAIAFSSEGGICGEYAQTHRLPYETFAPGNEIKPIATPLGKLGLSIGSDLFFPEVQWSLVQQGADILIHLSGESPVYDHFYSVLSPRVRALDVHRPFLLARPSSNAIKLVHNEEMAIPGVPMAGSVIIDQSGVVLASTGFSQGVAMSDLRLDQHCRSLESGANVPMTRGNDIYKLYFNDSRQRFFSGLREAYAPAPRPNYAKRKIRIALLTHFYSVQIGSGDNVLMPLLEEACAHKPDIVVTTEMEQGCKPDDPLIAESLKRMVAMTAKAGAYLLVGGVRVPDQPGTTDDASRPSHGWLWDREGRFVFESRIMLFGRGCGQEVFDTDFGRIGIRLCGDVYAPELSRLLALKGADIVFNPSMSWGASGLINTELNQVRAMDNGHFVASVHVAFSDSGQRSHVIDPMGGVVAASSFYDNSVLIADIDLDARRGVFVPEGRRNIEPGCYLEGFRSEVSHTLFPQSELFKLRRPELYEMLESDLPDHPFTARDRGDGGGPYR